jgi:hypothetical protein
VDSENLSAKLMEFREALRRECPSLYNKSVEGDCYANLLLRAAWALEESPHCAHPWARPSVSDPQAVKRG